MVFVSNFSSHSYLLYGFKSTSNNLGRRRIDVSTVYTQALGCGYAGAAGKVDNSSHDSSIKVVDVNKTNKK